MKYNNSTTFINYTDRTSSSNETGVSFTSSKSDSLSSILKNRVFVQANTIYPASLVVNSDPNDFKNSQAKKA